MKRSGFTLLEVVVSLSILLLLSSTFYYFFKAGLDSQRSARQLFDSLNRAQQIMEEGRALPFEDLISEDLEAGNLKVTSVDPNLKELVLTLIFDPKRSPLMIYTLRSK